MRFELKVGLIRTPSVMRTQVYVRIIRVRTYVRTYMVLRDFWLTDGRYFVKNVESNTLMSLKMWTSVIRSSFSSRWRRIRGGSGLANYNGQYMRPEQAATRYAAIPKDARRIEASCDLSYME